MSGRLEPFKQAQDYLPRLKAVFFGRWDEDKGCEITYQVPENSIRVTSTAPIDPSESALLDHETDSESNDQASFIDNHSETHQHGRAESHTNQQDRSQFLFEFTDIIDFILPKKHLCGHLVTVSSGSVKILGFPTLIEDEEKYERNFFMFNLCFVFDKDSELLGYEPVVRKTGRVLRSLEEKNSLLSAPSNSRFEIKSILEELFEELNSFSEVSISLNHQYRFPSTSSPSASSSSSPSRKRQQADNGQSSQPNHLRNHAQDLEPHPDRVISSTSALFLLNLKLFPFYGNPPKVEDWNVPISLVSFLKLRSEVTWDLTMFKLVPFIDGTATVRKISRLADVDIYLTRECIQHLVFFGCCIITDPFRFSNCYKLIGSTMLDLLGDSDDFESIKLQEELKDYISTDPVASSSSEPLKKTNWNDEGGGPDHQTRATDGGERDRSDDQLDHPVDLNDDVDELFLFNNDHRQHRHHSSSHSISNLLNLYNEFKSGITVHDWMEQNEVHKLNIDVRRFISFGTIKGFLKRVNCYPIWALHPDFCASQPATKNTPEQEEEHHHAPHELRSAPLSRPDSLSRSQSFTRGGRHRSGHFPSYRLSSSNIRQPAWLAVLKRLNHSHPLLSPPVNLSHEQYFDSGHPAHPEDSKKPTTRKKTLTSRKSSLATDPHHHHHSHHPHHHHPIRQSSHSHLHHLSVAVQVPKDLPLKLNGAHHLDELCVEFKISLVQLEQILRYIDTLSLEEITLSPHSSSSTFTLTSAMQTIYY
ncbi:hypothetical protein MJO28_007052 [Puccinia striiformis f. sp. tritici]|uniref:Nitrogen permease regulator 2 n=3 Tax=Puccinia striiformis f. sp. tritici TaxID=168172 RepID=A0A0L0VRX9_9BASI|nr:hypothetical protein Pst134EA_013150 [Puccinia striiformis f. sp. tritici]KAI9630615.1 hypothetical protein KEM48_013769 [Puccinia striiformis f. sp. tritici PST-130]KNF02033.1 hypothetical protein PSTG_04853 [Puccinia striiformis f. sp. tritici PST-78]KAH9454055.1 hypothetical protein Pst134EB_014151 [Puccinia striiformis f. sp. tritici]KAH9465259.1 hypothetical protein Pst134EA_013150 [Puccinia striiformis f. sp. tritici]KAI7951368.1 hypothetical protein MJO28_007052 [Puccinia striiformis